MTLQPGRAKVRAGVRHTGSVVLVGVALAFGVSACGGSAQPKSNSPSGGGSDTQRPQSGRQVFASAGCETCHTLGAAHSTGTIGPNLDHLEPTYPAVVKQVTYGGGGMPSFEGRISKAQIRAVAHFVADTSRRDH